MVTNERNPGSEGEGAPTLRTRRPARIAVLVAIAAPLVLVLAYALDRARHGDRALRNVWLADVPVGGMTAPEVEEVARELEQKLRGQALGVRVRDSAVDVSPATLSLRLDAAATARRAVSEGKAGGLWFEFRFWLARLKAPWAVAPVVEIDRGPLPALYDEWERRHLDLPFGGGVKVASGSVSADPPRRGWVVDRGSADEVIVRGLGSWPRQPVALPLVEREPFTVPGAVEAAVQQAMRITSDALTLRGDSGLELRLDREDVARALRSLAPTPAEPRVVLLLDASVIEEKLSPLREKLEAPPKNARFVVEGRDQIRIEPGTSGAVLKAEKVAQGLLDAALSSTRTGPLPLENGAPPEVTTEALGALNITRLVGQYTTHHPCCQPRVENIHRIADLLRGQVVKPGETFSVNALVGPRTAKSGFKPAPTIEEGEMVDSLGGGVSQFATTLFNALFLAGYDIVERTPHTFWFARYPMGRDATLSWPKPDVAFKNDSDAGALIWTEYGDDHITVKVFGDTGGRKVRIKVSPQQNLVKPPIEYIPDLTQSHEKDKTMEAGQIGWTVFVSREVELAGGTKREEKRKVVYKPRTRRVVVHPCRVPKGEPGHTGEKCPEPDGGTGEE